MKGFTSALDCRVNHCEYTFSFSSSSAAMKARGSSWTEFSIGGGKKPSRVRRANDDAHDTIGTYYKHANKLNAASFFVVPDASLSQPEK